MRQVTGIVFESKRLTPGDIMINILFFIYIYMKRKTKIEFLQHGLDELQDAQVFLFLFIFFPSYVTERGLIYQLKYFLWVTENHNRF